MRWKTTWTSLLAALLLLTSSAASACQLRCNVTAALGSCHGMQSAMVASEGSAHTHMAGMRSASATSPAAASLAAQHVCDDHICIQQSARAQARDTRQLRLFIETATQQTTAQFPSKLITAALVAETPPLAKDSPVTLRTTLRV